MSCDKLDEAVILLELQKYAEAEKLLGSMLSEYPNDPYIFNLLAQANMLQNKLSDALALIEKAIQLSPDSPASFYNKARILARLDNLEEAEECIEEAIRLNPEDADYFAFLANIMFARNEFEDALGMANKALEINAENTLALTTRGSAFIKLGKKEEFFEAMQSALREAPNDAYAHASYGWGLLESGERKKSLEHFREALRNEPGLDYARSGMAEAMKAANPIYRLFLRYQFLMDKISYGQKWGIIIGFCLIIRILGNLAKNSESAFLMALPISLAAIALFTWLAKSIGSVILRFSRYGRFLLNKNEMTSSNLVAGSFCVAVVGGLLCIADVKFAMVAVFGFAMMFPFSVMFDKLKYRYFLWFYSLALFLLGIASIAEVFLTGDINIFAISFVSFSIIFLWLANLFRI